MSDADPDLVGVVRGLTRQAPRFAVDANLSVTVDGTRLAISTHAERLRVQVPSVTAGLRLARNDRDRLPTVAGLLDDAGLTAEVRVGNAVLAVLGAEATPGAPARRLGLGAVELRPRGVVAATLRLR
ncbi:MAG: hypothetical protein ACI9CA_001382 [Natronomonas sp.]